VFGLYQIITLLPMLLITVTMTGIFWHCWQWKQNWEYW